MADDTIPGAVAAPAAEPVPAPQPAVAPDASPPSVADAAPAAATPIQAAGDGLPVADAPAVVEPVADAPALRPHTETQPGLLGADLAGEVSKPADDATAKPAETPKPAVDAAAAEPSADTPLAAALEPLTYEPPTLPDGVMLDSERVGVFDKIVGAVRLSPEVRQELLDLYITERQDDATRTMQAQHDAFAAYKGDLARQTMEDPEIGGAGFRTSVAAADRMIQTFTTAEQRPAFLDMLRSTGADSHPEMVRFLVNLSRRFDEPALPAPNPQPPPDIGRRPGGRGGMQSLYNNPRSAEVLNR